MKIVSAKVHELRIPMETGGPHGWGDEEWKEFEFILLEVTTDGGLVGWGETWTYTDASATATELKSNIVPQIISREVSDVAAFTSDLLRDNPVRERGAPSTFAISAVDIALWDISGKAAGLPLHCLLGEARHERLPVFASFFRFDDPSLTYDMCSRALAERMCWLKLHEIREDCVRAAREAAPDTKLILDVNCEWTPQEAVEMVRALQTYDLYWLEEPIHPPTDIESLALLKFAGIPIGIGEHAYTLDDFQQIIDAGTVDYLQPGILKMGGINEVQKVLKLASTKGVAAFPYTPFHGPGLLASLHMMATLPGPIPVEFFYYTSMEGLLYGDALTPKDGYLSVPQTPGLGYEPDPEVLSRFAV